MFHEFRGKLASFIWSFGNRGLLKYPCLVEDYNFSYLITMNVVMVRVNSVSIIIHVLSVHTNKVILRMDISVHIILCRPLLNRTMKS